MTRVIPIGFLACLIPGVLVAQDPKLLDQCMNQARTQLAMLHCASEEAKRVDTEMNVVYQRLLLVAQTEAGASAKIRTAQNAWTAYRDAFIEAMYPAEDKQANYGSRYATDVNLIWADLSRRQIDELRNLLQRYQAKN